jgi:pimeloyl-ACP methyl ester carboxylesterase
VFRSKAASGHVIAPDGTKIAWYREAPAVEGDGTTTLTTGSARSDGEAGPPPLLLVHGTTADHTTFRQLGPRMAGSRIVVSMDRRGRGGSGDTLPYAIEREFEDVATVAEALATATGGPIDAFGHSYGGRCVLGAALLTPAIRRVVAYEGTVRPAVGDRDPALLARLDQLLAEGRDAELVEVFLREGVGFTDDDWLDFRTSPAFPARVAAAWTVTRELRAGAANGSALDRYVTVARPVLVVIGSDSPPSFAAGAHELARRLPDGRLAIIEGARHGAHHTHLDALVAAIEPFLGRPDDARATIGA